MSSEIRRILVPLDGSEVSRLSLETILPIIALRNASVALLHVSAPPDSSTEIPPFLYAAAAELQARAIRASLNVRRGDPAEEILAFARQEEVDLIAMGTHGRTGLQRWVLGSVTEQVLRKAPVPLLVSRVGAVRTSWDILLVALDGSPEAEEILPDVVGLTRNRRADVRLAKAVLPVPVPSGLGDVGLLVPPEDPRPYLESVAGRLAAQGVAARPVPLEGRASTEIPRYARDSGVGLLCMTTHGRSGVGRAVLGSVAEEILRHAPCPVFVRRVGSGRETPK